MTCKFLALSRQQVRALRKNREVGEERREKGLSAGRQKSCREPGGQGEEGGDRLNNKVEVAVFLKDEPCSPCSRQVSRK